MDTNFALKFINKFTPNSISLDSFQGNKNAQTNRNISEDLPDGSCFSRVLKFQPQPEMSCESVIKKCEVSIYLNCICIRKFPITLQ